VRGFRQVEPILLGSPRRAVVTATVLTALVVFVVTTIPTIATAIGAAVSLLAIPVSIVLGKFENEAKQLLGKLLGHFASVSKTAERESVRQDIEGTLSLGIARLADSLPEMATTTVRLDYIKTKHQLGQLADGTIVIAIAPHENRERNLATAAVTYVQACIIPEARPYMDPDVSQGLDLVLAKEILSAAGPQTVRDFLASVWTPAIFGRDRLRELGGKLERLHEDRLLGPIVISEFADLAASMGFRFPRDEIALETAQFVDYLYDLTIREPGDDVGDRANFEGKSLRCRIVFVARPGVYEVEGPSPYRKAIDWAIQRAYHRVYLLATGKNLAYAREVVTPYGLDKRIKSVTEHLWTVRTTAGRSVPHLVVRIAVDVQYHVGIGQRPLVAIGPGHPTGVRSDHHRVG
jgi:hypothetical protein